MSSIEDLYTRVQSDQTLAEVFPDVKQAIAWVLDKRNEDGGYPAEYVDETSGWWITCQILYLNWILGFQILQGKQLRKTLHFLKKGQRRNGGWPEAGGKIPIVGITSNVIRALSIYDSTYITRKKIKKGILFLLEHQNTDGGWSYQRNSPSRAYATYMVLNAFKFSRALQDRGMSERIEEAIYSALKYLLDSQKDDGGWGEKGAKGDTANTACALLAFKLWESHLADLPKRYDEYELGKISKKINGGEEWLIRNSNGGKWDLTECQQESFTDGYTTHNFSYVLHGANFALRYISSSEEYVSTHKELIKSTLHFYTMMQSTDGAWLKSWSRKKCTWLTTQILLSVFLLFHPQLERGLSTHQPSPSTVTKLLNDLLYGFSLLRKTTLLWLFGFAISVPVNLFLWQSKRVDEFYIEVFYTIYSVLLGIELFRKR